MKSIIALFLLAPLASAAAQNPISWDIYRMGTVADFAWKNPMPADGGVLNGYVSCATVRNFNATQYKFSDVREARPRGLAPWAGVVDGLAASRAYPGGWEGVNYKGDNRDVVLMEYKDVPAAARAWVEEQLADEAQRLKRFMAVLAKPSGEAGEVSDGNIGGLPLEEKLLMFAPGELYDFLPLWVSHDSECEAELKDLTKYVPHLRDDAVIAWAKPVEYPDRDSGGRDVSFAVDARYIRETEEGRTARLFWERAHAMASRHHRKQLREERRGKRALTQAQRKDKDEL